MNIIYDTHTGGNTKYASLDKFDRQRVLQKLTQNFYKMLEDAYMDPEKSEMLKCPNTDYRKNSAGKTNSLQSFLAGILAQHNLSERDFSVWQLTGITTASLVFDHYYRSGEINFKKGSIISEVKTLHDNPLFKIGTR